MHPLHWKPEEDKIIIENIGKMRYKDMMKFLPNRSVKSIRRRALYGLKINNKKLICRTLDYDKNFWTIPNIINCYWAGFLSADGNIGKYGKNDAGQVVRCELSIVDTKHLQLLKETTRFTGELKFATRKCNLTQNSISETVKINYSGANQWVQDLEKFNVIPDKTLRIGPPNFWRNEFLFSFIAGFIDGDGCISKINDGRIAIIFSSSSEKMLNWLKDFFDSKFEYKSGLQNITSFSQSKNCKRLTLNGYRAAIVFDYMKDLPVPKLDRKWKNPVILDQVNIYKQKHPELFGNYDNLPKIENYLQFLPKI